MQKTVVFILSSNYSGSTWLALLLGSHSRAAYVGELNKMFHDPPVPCRLCEERNRPCPVFYDASETRVRDIHAKVFDRTGAQLIVDNSKTLSWSRKFLGEVPFARRYIHLIRDPRAVAYSLVTRGKPVDLQKWVRKNREIQDFLDSNQLPYRRVLYNDLAESLETSLQALCQWLGLDFEPSQLAYWEFEHHGPGRNGATAAFLEHYTPSEDDFYEQNRRKNFHDLRWQSGLPEALCRQIEMDPHIHQMLDDFGLKLGAMGLVCVNAFEPMSGEKE